MYVYIKSQAGDDALYTVGFYDPKGDWHPESDHTSDTAAAQRVAWLNGSGPKSVVAHLSADDLYEMTHRRRA